MATKSTSKCLFETMLSKNDSELLSKRASIVLKSAKSQSLRLIQDLEDKIGEIEIKILNLEDLSPKTTTSLIIADGEFDAKTWVEDLQKLNVSKRNLDIQLEIAQATHDKFFKAE